MVFIKRVDCITRFSAITLKVKSHPNNYIYNVLPNTVAAHLHTFIEKDILFVTDQTDDEKVL